MCDEYEQRLELIEKERKYFQGLNDDKDKDIAKLNQSVRDNESHETSARKIYEEKLKKAEESKLQLLSGKNSETNRLA